MIIAMDIANMFKSKKHYYEVKGALASSLVACHLHIHNLDCFKHECDFHICHGLNFEKSYSLDFVISNEYKGKVDKDIKELLYGDKPIIKINGNNVILSTSFILPKTEDVYSRCAVVKIEQIENGYV